jgi:hypothetical protein
MDLPTRQCQMQYGRQNDLIFKMYTKASRMPKIAGYTNYRNIERRLTARVDQTAQSVALVASGVAWRLPIPKLDIEILMGRSSPRSTSWM